MPRGGARRGAGAPKGKRGQHAKTLEKLAARELARQIITRHMEPMILRQIAHSMGIGHLYTRDKSGKFTKVESQAKVDELLTQGEEDKDYWIFTKDPSVQAFTDLLNRALDKPKEQEQEIKVSGEVTLVEKVRQLRARQGRAA